MGGSSAEHTLLRIVVDEPVSGSDVHVVSCADTARGLIDTATVTQTTRHQSSSRTVSAKHAAPDTQVTADAYQLWPSIAVAFERSWWRRACISNKAAEPHVSFHPFDVIGSREARDQCG